MDQFCVALPILPGQSGAARAAMAALEGERRADYVCSEQRLGITSEAWFLAASPAGEQLIAYMESPDIATAVQRFIASRDAFDLWFKQQLRDATGLDLHNLPPGVEFPKLVSSYRA